MTDPQGVKPRPFAPGLLALLVALGAAGCNEQQTSAEVYTAHQFLNAGNSDKDLGDDCGKHGPKDCRSGVCIHTQPGSADGWVCSKPCASDEDCPSQPVQWRCFEIYPAPGNQVCLPPSPVPEGQPVDDVVE